MANQRGKIYSNFIRTDVLEIQLTGVENFLVWYNQLLKVMEKCGSTIDQGILLAQIKRSIKHPDDITNTRSMSGLNQVVTYLKSKYQLHPQLAALSLSQFKDLKSPLDNIEVSIRNISLILPRLKILQDFNLLGKLHRGILGNLEGKAFISIRLQIYNQKKSKKLDAEKRARFKQNILACDEGSVV